MPKSFFLRWITVQDETLVRTADKLLPLWPRPAERRERSADASNFLCLFMTARAVFKNYFRLILFIFVYWFIFIYFDD